MDGLIKQEEKAENLRGLRQMDKLIISRRENAGNVF
jgi:hypothetical protein